MKKKLWYWVEAKDKDDNPLTYCSSTMLSQSGMWIDIYTDCDSNKYFMSSSMRIRNRKQLFKYINAHPHIKFIVRQVLCTKSKRTFIQTMIFNISN